MSKKNKNQVRKKIGRAFVRTSFINLGITLFIFYVVLHKKNFEDFIDVFIICLLVGLSAYSFAKIGIHFIKKQLNHKDIFYPILWIIASALSGSFLSLLFFYFNTGMTVQSVFKQIFIYTFIFGIIAETALLHYFYSQKKIENSNQMIHEEKIRRLKLEKEQAITTMKLMQAQIEPHFLFNTLSNLIILVDLNAKKAKRMLIDLNEYLRIALQRTRMEMITLDQELELIRRYLDILKVRMGNRLAYEIIKKGDYAYIHFPPMIIHPLVENAVKHGIEPKKDGGIITIECTVEPGNLKISVSDTGLGMGEIDDTTGIGLNNICERLEHVYGHQAKLTIKKNTPSGVKAVVEVTF